MTTTDDDTSMGNQSETILIIKNLNAENNRLKFMVTLLYNHVLKASHCPHKKVQRMLTALC